MKKRDKVLSAKTNWLLLAQKSLDNLVKSHIFMT